MTEQEQINSNIQRQIDAQNARIDSVLAKVDAIISEVHDMRQEMRDRDNQRAAEIIELRQKHAAEMKEFQKNFYAKMDNLEAKMNAKFEKLGEQFRTLAVVSMASIGAIVITVIVSLTKS